MKGYNCIIIEDEPVAAEILEDYIRLVPFLNLKKTCTDALFALDILNQEKIDLIFLDLHLPRLKGFDFIKTLPQPPQIIITTAYHEYALKGYEYQVIDYLLKPFEFSRFLQAVNKLNSARVVSPVDFTREDHQERQFQFFNVNKKKVKAFNDEILYIEGLKEYIRLVTKTQSIVTKIQLGQIEETLPARQFIRIHRSFIVAKDKLDSFSATSVVVNGKSIPIGRSYKEKVLEILNKG